MIKKITKPLLNIYFTAGYPQLNDTTKIIETLNNAGVDFIEIGIPYSDPLADGPIIQQTASQALKNGMNLELLFQQLKKIKPNLHSKLILMGYLNQVLQFGYEKFCYEAHKAHIYGLILPDLTPAEYEKSFKKWTDKYQLKMAFLVTPNTPQKRILQLDNLSSAFLYVVSVNSTTGSQNNFKNITLPFLRQLNKLPIKNKKLLGFGIKTKADINLVKNEVDGVIIGSHFLKSLSSDTLNPQDISKFVAELV
ncbi:MAG: tryptophan synthase subunit alpha [Sediminibacterium sp.]|nr:tryptophan synthase subunit alpha [Sediminibacterium sp.]